MTLDKFAHDAYRVSYFTTHFLVTRTMGIWYIFDEDGQFVRIAHKLSDAVTYLEWLAAQPV